VTGYDAALTAAAGAGHLELNPFMPLIAESLLQSLDLLVASAGILNTHCVAALQADAARCRALVGAATATATALIPKLGYDRVNRLCEQARQSGRSIMALCVEEGCLTPEEFEQCISPEAVCRLGTPEVPS